MRVAGVQEDTLVTVGSVVLPQPPHRRVGTGLAVAVAVALVQKTSVAAASGVGKAEALGFWVRVLTDRVVQHKPLLMETVYLALRAAEAPVERTAGVVPLIVIR
jgi:hypothetical protein